MAELTWEGKYDKDGRRVAPPRVALPFQTVETVNESAQDRQRSLDLFGSGRDSEWRNRLTWGDKKYVLPSLLPEFAGKIDLIYIDPPFATGADFSFSTHIPEGAETFTKQPNVIEQKAYRDTWGRGLDGYLGWFSEAASTLYDLLSDTGSMYVHIGPNVDHMVRHVLDEFFGREHFQNQIVWKRSAAHSDTKQGRKQYGNLHDVLLYYTKGSQWTWHPQYAAYDDEYTRSHYGQVEADTGRRFRTDNLTAARPGGDTSYEWKGVRPPTGRYWAYSLRNMEEFERQGRLVYSASGMPSYKRYLDEMPGVSLQTIWTDIPPVNSQALERVDYPTQKPEALLQRILCVSSNEGDLVLDCFAGSGTTAVAAEKLNRRWIAADLGRFAIHTTRKRLLSIPNVKPFVVQNLGKYERQAWQGAEFGDGAELAYRRFILDLYHAQPVNGYAWLHGLRSGHLVHVGSVDAPISTGDVRQIAMEFKRSMGTGEQAPKTNRVDVLGWDFAFELNEVARQQAALASIDFHFIRIPREVLDKKAVEQGDISFFELAALAVDVSQQGRDVTLTLTDFVIPLDDVPEDVQRAITHWSQWIDYWAVDWDNKSDTFHNQWQTYRTRKDPTLLRSVTRAYEEPGCYTVVVKVIDILGNDTTKTLQVEVP